MPRTGISYEQVVAAALALEQDAKKPTISNVREQLGKGSSTTISNFLRQWKATKNTPRHKTDSGEPQLELKITTTESKPKVKQPSIVKDEAQPEQPVKRKKAPSFAMLNKQKKAKAPQENRPEPSQKKAKQDKPIRRVIKRPELDKLTIEPTEPVTVKPAVELNDLDKSQLILRVRQLQAELSKEQAIREALEKTAREACEYADAIKEQTIKRINHFRQEADAEISDWKSKNTALQQQYDMDINHYREQFDQVNRFIVELKRPL